MPNSATHSDSDLDNEVQQVVVVEGLLNQAAQTEDLEAAFEAFTQAMEANNRLPADEPES